MNLFNDLKSMFSTNIPKPSNETQKSSNEGYIEVKGETKTAWNNQRKYSIQKNIHPNYLYKPLFGIPRDINYEFVRTLSKNPYVMSVINTIQKIISSVDWDIVYKEEIEKTEKTETTEKFRKEIINFFKNPNAEDESFGDLLKKIVLDLIVIDSAVINKIYSIDKKLVQLKVLDGATIVKNPDQHGNLQNREDLILDEFIKPNIREYGNNYELYQKDLQLEFKNFYAEKSAYFQYTSFQTIQLPTPFGKKEIIYMMMNPSTQNVYSYSSPIQTCLDLALNLIFGSRYNLDTYLNSNTPDGIISAIGLDEEGLRALKQNLTSTATEFDEQTGLFRKVGAKMGFVNTPDLKFTPLNLSSKEMEIVSQQEWFSKLLWLCLGITPNELGFTEGTNKATDENQSAVSKRKMVKPFLKKISECINRNIINELEGGEFFEFKFDEYDINDEIKKRQLQQMEVNLGIKTPDMIAEEEGINVEELKKQREENMVKEEFMKSLRYQRDLNYEKIVDFVEKGKKTNEILKQLNNKISPIQNLSYDDILELSNDEIELNEEVLHNLIEDFKKDTNMGDEDRKKFMNPEDIKFIYTKSENKNLENTMGEVKKEVKNKIDEVIKDLENE